MICRLCRKDFKLGENVVSVSRELRINDYGNYWGTGRMVMPSKETYEINDYCFHPECFNKVASKDFFERFK